MVSMTESYGATFAELYKLGLDARPKRDRLEVEEAEAEVAVVEESISDD